MSTRMAAVVALALCWGCNLEQEHARKALESQEAVMRAEGVSVLARSGDVKMAPLLVPLLRDPSARVRRNVVAGLGALGPQPYVGKIAGRLRDSDLEVRLAAVRVLGDSKHARAARMLLPMLQDQSLVIRRAAARALEGLGLSARQQAERVAANEVSHQLKRLQLEDAQLRASAAREIGLAGQPVHLPTLVKMLGDRSPLVVTQAARAVGLMGGPGAKKALVRLAASARSLDRVAAAGGLGGLGDHVLLASLAADPEPEVRAAAHAELVLIARTRAVVMSPALCKGLLDPQLRIAVLAASLARAQPASCEQEVKKLLAQLNALITGKEPVTVSVDPGSMDRLVKVLGPLKRAGVDTSLLRLSQSLYRAWRVESVKWIKPSRWRQIAGGKVLPASPASLKPTSRKGLRKLLAKYPERVAGGLLEDPLMPPRVSRELVMSAIKSLGGRPGALTWLAAIAVEGEAAVRVAALDALAAMDPGTVSARASDAVSKNLTSTRAEVRRAAARACVLLGAGAAAAALKMLGSRDFEMRAAGATCLGSKRHVPAVTALLALLAREKQVAVIQALARIGDRRATAPMIALLQQDHHAERWSERQVVVTSLGILGDPAAAAALERELNHPHWAVRLAAARALARAGRPSSARQLTVCQADYHARIRAACALSARALERPRR